MCVCVHVCICAHVGVCSVCVWIMSVSLLCTGISFSSNHVYRRSRRRGGRCTRNHRQKTWTDALMRVGSLCTPTRTSVCALVRCMHLTHRLFHSLSFALSILSASIDDSTQLHAHPASLSLTLPHPRALYLITPSLSSLALWARV